MNYLFICGTARSGTTAMWRLLTSDERIVLGLERYSVLYDKQKPNKELFSFERFHDLRQHDTFYQSFPPYYQKAERLFNNALYIGDKTPKLFNHLDSLLTQIPSAKVIFMLRNIIDVAASYEARANNEDDKTWSATRRTAHAINDWKQSLMILKQYSDDERVLPIIYEDFFSANNTLEPLYQFLELKTNDAVNLAYNNIINKSSKLEGQRKRELTINAVQQICETAPFGLYREVLQKIRAKQNK
ncbi:MAG: sulfotransferase [Methylococcaceae bacterium]